MSELDFSEHRKLTAEDCRALAGFIEDVAAAADEGDMGRFERFFIEGGTEEGDSRLAEMHQRLIFRYLYRTEVLATPPADPEAEP